MSVLALFLSFLLILPNPFGQALSRKGIGKAHAAAGFITLGVHNNHDNGATSATSVVVTLTGVSVGSTIFCWLKIPYSASNLGVTVSDNVNSGNYLPMNSIQTDFNLSYWGSYAKYNSAAGNPTITASYTNTGTNAAISCEEWKNVRVKYALDSPFLQTSTPNGTTGTNPTTGSNLTPTNANELVTASVDDTVTPTAGTNYTLIDTNATSGWYPEYWIQGAATATAGNFSAASGTYRDHMAALAKTDSNFCDSNVLFDWSGLTDGTAPTLTTLNSSAKGVAAQPNSQLPSSGAGQGWGFFGSALSGFLGSTASRAALETSRSCPSWTGKGSSGIGMTYNTGTSPAQSASFNFDTTSKTATLSGCIAFTISQNFTGTVDVLTIYADTGFGNNDFANARLDGNGAGTVTFNIEIASSSVLTGPSISMSADTAHPHWYYAQLQFVAAGGNATLKVWDGGTTVGSCTQGSELADSTLHIATNATSSVPDRFVFGSQGGGTPAGLVMYSSFVGEYEGSTTSISH